CSFNVSFILPQNLADTFLIGPLLGFEVVMSSAFLIIALFFLSFQKRFLFKFNLLDLLICSSGIYIVFLNYLVIGEDYISDKIIVYELLIVLYFIIKSHTSYLIKYNLL